MNEKIQVIKEIEEQIENTLWSKELREEIDQALQVYLEAETKLSTLNITAEEPGYPELQQVLAYCLMRQSNILRQKGELEGALAIGEREIAAAKASKDELTLSRSLMSNGTNHIITGEVERGLEMIEGAREIFMGGDSYDHKQGLGWYWILQADLATAGIIAREPSEIHEIADRALETLKPIKNWPGVARGYAARAEAYERMGKEEEASNDRKMQQFYDTKDELKDAGV